MNSKKLIGIMAEKGISQRSLAKEVGVSLTTINNKLTCKVPFNTDEIVKVCKVLNITDPTTKIEIFLQ